ncbi:MAG: MATE family efflux transporter [Bacteroidales bacterium]|nr:MATE family efflux transporter [Bacteroidales bacterium]
MNREILRLAIPNIITTLTVPLLGMVDLAIVGNMGSETYIGAIALGTMIFNMIYWNFGFLRMGTSGFTVQACGAGDREEAVHILFRALLIGLAAAGVLVLLQYPIRLLVFRLVEGSAGVEAVAAQYFHICIWAAPAILGLYAFKGWFIGMQNARLPMWIAIFMDVTNIALSLCFVFVFKMKIAGVALGTVLAQYAGLAAAVSCWLRNYRSDLRLFSWKAVCSREKMMAFFRVNADIFLRTLCLIAVFTFIPAAGARMGDDFLSANTLLMQFFTLFSYVMDGFAYAGESLVGKYVGAQNRERMRKAIRHLFGWDD